MSERAVPLGAEGWFMWARARFAHLGVAYRRIAPWAFAAIVVGMWIEAPPSIGLIDAKAYFRAAASPASMYALHTTGDAYAYLYPPAFAQVLAPLAAAGWIAFSAAWSALLAGALWWLAREWSPVLVVLPLAVPWVGRCCSLPWGSSSL